MIIKTTINAIIYLLCVIVLGIIFPFVISVIATCLTPVTMLECTSSVPFWLFFIICTIVAAIYLDIESNK